MSQNPNPAIAIAGIDIGKNSFHIVGLDQRGAIVLRQKWSRGQIDARLTNMPPCLIGMEACVGAHRTMSACCQFHRTWMDETFRGSVAQRNEDRGGVSRRLSSGLPPLFRTRRVDIQVGSLSVNWPDLRERADIRQRAAYPIGADCVNEAHV